MTGFAQPPSAPQEDACFSDTSSPCLARYSMLAASAVLIHIVKVTVMYAVISYVRKPESGSIPAR
jgi:hypothetical protein